MNVKRILDCNASDFKHMHKKEILESILLSEGRVLVAEIVGVFDPTLHSVSNAELVAAFGADILLLNMFDVYQPVFQGLPNVESGQIIQTIKSLTGRLVGINLEPVDDHHATSNNMSRGRIATVATVKRAIELGADFIVLTGNPHTGVTNESIIDALKELSAQFGEQIILIAGKMHAAGSLYESGENLVTLNDVEHFIDAGADVVMLPAPGTIPGITQAYVQSLVQYAHQRNVLTMTAIGTSQEDADEQTIKQIALMSKMTGTDIHHIGDAGYKSANPENIMTYSVSIKGKRHTYVRMARSVNR